MLICTGLSNSECLRILDGNSDGCVFSFIFTVVLFGWFCNVLVNNYAISRTGSETERGDHDLCLSWSHYIDNDPISRAQAATAGIEPRTSSPGVTHFTD